MEAPSPTTPPVLSPGPVGLVGIGAIGGGIGLSLRRAGITVHYTSRRADAGAELGEAGAERHKDAKAVGRAVGAGIAFTAVPDARSLDRVLFGRSGLAAGLGPGALVVQTSTISPEQTRSAAARLAERGIGMLDSPVGGSREPARRGQLLLYVGGSADELRRADPVLRPISREIVHVGDLGAGSAMKLVNNLVTIGTVELLAEALALADSSGIDRPRALEILAKGGARSAMLEGKTGMLAERRYDPNFSLDLARKDLRLVDQTAHLVGRSLPVAHQIRRVYDRASSEGRGALDFTAVLETVLGAAPYPAPSKPAEPDGGDSGS